MSYYKEYKSYNINQALKLLKEGKAICTTTYTAAVFYRKEDGTIWMNHPEHKRDRLYYKSLNAFKTFNKDSRFYAKKKQYNPYFVGKFILEEAEFNNKNVRSFWSHPHYGTKLRKQALALR